MNKSTQTPEVVRRRLEYFSNTLSEIINQVNDLSKSHSHEFFHRGQGNSSTFDPSGFIEKIKLQLSFSFNASNLESPTEKVPDLYFSKEYFNHHEMVSLLNQILTELSEQEFKSMDDLQKFYQSVMDRIEELRVKEVE